MTAKVIRKNKGLLKTFSTYKKRYLDVGKTPDITKLLPENLYSTMRLSGEEITREEAYALFK